MSALDDHRVQRRDRALAALHGVAVGDALGMPTQTWSREHIAARYGFVGDFVDAAAEQPVSAGLPAGSITDDTEQTLLLAEHLIARDGAFDEQVWAVQLLDWERDVRARGVADLLGPSTRRAIEALQQGTPVTETGRRGTTNGAAMRVVPVAIANRAEPLDALIDAVEHTCRLTHNTSEAIGAAAAVAAFVSAGIDGARLADAFAVAMCAAQLGETRGAPAVQGSIAEAILQAWQRAGEMDAMFPAEDVRLDGTHPGVMYAFELAEHIGTSVAAIEAVPMAFALCRLTHAEPWTTAQLAANIGDDTDTIGAIACAMGAALQGMASLPAAAVHCVSTVNTLPAVPLVDALLRIRDAGVLQP